MPPERPADPAAEAQLEVAQQSATGTSGKRQQYREGVDYTLDAQGRWVFTAVHLRQRGYCCYQACRNCPWGQQGRTRKDAFEDLQARLDRLESLLQEQGLAIEVTGYRLGTVQARPAEGACLTDLPALTRRVIETGRDVMTVVDVAWE
jgi:Family of unknown function (DUF5522)